MSGTVIKEPLKIVIFLGSTRNNRMVERVGAYVRTIVENKCMIPITIGKLNFQSKLYFFFKNWVSDPIKINFEVLKQPLHFYQNPSDAPQWLRDINDTIKQADGFIILSSEYNATIPPALTNMIDHFPPSSFRHRPVGFVTYSMGMF